MPFTAIRVSNYFNDNLFNKGSINVRIFLCTMYTHELYHPKYYAGIISSYGGIAFLIGHKLTYPHIYVTKSVKRSRDKFLEKNTASSMRNRLRTKCRRRRWLIAAENSMLDSCSRFLERHSPTDTHTHTHTRK